MPNITVKVQNAAGDPLPDLMDVHFEFEGAVVASKFDVDGAKAVAAKLTGNRIYAVRVFPARHRPVSRFVSLGGGDQTCSLITPIQPDRVVQVNFEDFARLPADFKEAMKRAAVEGMPDTGKKLYDALDPLSKAGLLNLFTKMTNTALPASGSAWSFVDSLYRIRPDRIFFDALPGYRDALKAAVASKSFKTADDSLHTPPDGFEHAGSFKSLDAHGNLQVTFFAKPGNPPTFKVDADIDEEDGIGHAFEVIRNTLTGGTTHPFDVHQILTLHFKAPPYELLVRN